MKLIIITQGISPILHPLYKSKHNIIGIIESAPRLRKNTPKVNTSSIFRKNRLDAHCINRGIPYFFYEKGKEFELIEWINTRRPDLMIVQSMSQLLIKEIYTIPKYGTINIHGSYLPEY